MHLTECNSLPEAIQFTAAKAELECNECCCTELIDCPELSSELKPTWIKHSEFGLHISHSSRANSD